MAIEVLTVDSCRVAVLRISNPPLNEVSERLRHFLIHELDKIDTAKDVDAIVLCGGPKAFATSQPIPEVEAGRMAPSLEFLCRRIEEMSKPVIAFLEGHVAGAGLEIALAAHARVAHPNARLGFPDLHMGLCPSGGATQRLPRLVGAARALEMLIGAVAHRANSRVCTGLVDRLTNGAKGLEQAVEYAQDIYQSGLWARTRDRSDGFENADLYVQNIADWRARQGCDRRAEKEIINLVEAAPQTTFDTGIAKERAAFEELCNSARSRGLRRARYSEQYCRSITSHRSDAEICFAMYPGSNVGGRIAGAAALAGLNSVLIDPDETHVIQTLGDVRFRLMRQTARRGMPRQVGREIAGRVSALADLGELARAAVVVVSGRNSPDVLARRLAEIAPYVSDGAVVLCLAGDLDCEWLAPASLAGRVLGVSLPDMDFPARLAEIKVSDATNLLALAKAQAGLRKLGRVLVTSPAGLPSISTVLFDAMLGAADQLVVAGVAPALVDQAMLERGHARGAFEMLRQVNASAYLERAEIDGRAQNFSTQLLQQGIAPPIGAKSNSLLDSLAAGMRLGGPWSPPSVVVNSAITVALANAGCRLIEQGVVQQAMQIDVCMLHGWGYARETGGPMAEADQMGLAQLVQLGHQLDARLGHAPKGIWTPHPILKALVSTQGSFIDLKSARATSKVA